MEAKKQRAVLQSKYGNSKDVLKWSDSFPIKDPKENEIQIKVYASSINPIDWQMLEGNRKLIHKRIFPYIPFFDLAGEVVAVGSGVKRFKVGDAVMADNKINGGGLSEYINVDENLASKKPSNITYSEAAAIPLAAQTAYLSIIRAGINRNSRVLIIGASGGVGTFAIQIAKALGAKEIIAVSSSRNIELVKALGADKVIDYTKGEWVKSLDENSLDAILDFVGGKNQWIDAKKTLKPKGKFVTISRDEDGEATLWSSIKLATSISARIIGSYVGKKIKYIPIFLNASAQLLDKVATLVESGKVKPYIQNRYSFNIDDVNQIIADSKLGRMVGKSVVEIIKINSDQE